MAKRRVLWPAAGYTGDVFDVYRTAKRIMIARGFPMLKKILLALVALVAVFAGYVALQPGAYSVTRSATIAAPPEAVYAHISNLRRWDAWSPWAKRDPNAKATFAGPEDGPGAAFTWSGNDEIGEGTMTIVDAQPARAVKIKLDFVKPFPATSDVAFVLQPEGQGTRVTWSISGEQGFIARAFCTLLRVDLDQMIGSDYEKGLVALKAVVEAGKT